MNLNEQQMNQLHLTIERFRVPEILFQPSIIGKQSCGLIEGIENVLSFYSNEIQNDIVQNLFLSGGNFLFKNMKNRIENDFRMIRPSDSTFNIFQEQNSILDSWKGASIFSKQDNFNDFCIQKSEYEEYGSEYFKSHQFSNEV